MYPSGDFISRFDGVNWTHYRMDSLGLPPKLMFIAEDRHGLWFRPTVTVSPILVRFTPNGQWKSYKLEDEGNCFYDTKAASIKFLADSAFTYDYLPQEDAFVRSEKPLIPSAGPQSIQHFCQVWYDEKQNIYISDWEVKAAVGKTFYGDGFAHQFDYKAGSRIVDINKNIVALEINGWPYLQKWGQSHPFSFTLPDGTPGKFIKWAQLIEWDNGPSQLNQAGFLVKHSTTGVMYLFDLKDDGTIELLLSDIFGDGYHSFSQDPQGNWWYGTSSGLARTDRSQLVFNERSPEMVGGLHAIGQDAGGNIWLGGYNGQGGFSMFDGQQLRRRVFSEKSIPVLPGHYLRVCFEI